MEPIAIIGIACRFPGADGPAAFWRLLCDGRDVTREVPPGRWDADALYDPDPAAPGKAVTRRGGFLDAVDLFDPLFFRISPREAVRMDPQQRLVLELAWEALEDAGLVPARLRGSRTGVFLGFGVPEYHLAQYAVPEQIDGYTSTGCVPCILSNRVSYVFDFRGPSLSLDTACSSSLVAAHLACRSLDRRECDLALAGGVSLMVSPVTTVGYSKLQALAPDGRCKTFDARANGYARGEGAGLVVLKPLEAALADGDEVYAVLRGGAVNQDGRTNGLTAPNRFSQEDVLRRAYADAGVSPGAVGYVEAHGTGTLLGDPIEAKALGAVLARDRPPGRPCAIGSVKTNFGHLEAAAGAASLIKVALALRHRLIPPSLHFQTPNPHIPFRDLPLRVQQGLGPWPDGPAWAGVSAFGFGGTNAHLVLGEVPGQAQRAGGSESVPEGALVGVPPIGGWGREEPPKGGTPTGLLPLSAHSPEALRAVARSYRNFLAGRAAGFGQVCACVARHRSHHDHRLGVVADGTAAAIEALDAFLEGRPAGGVAAGCRPRQRLPRVAFLFTGQGSQYVGMGRRLYQAQPVFRRALEFCDEVLRPLLGRSLLSVLYPEGEESSLHETAFTQPALFALGYALARQWEAWGVRPDVVLGHSLGEYAAACAAGILSPEGALRLVAERARLMQELPTGGAMASVFATPERVGAAARPHGERLALAAVNGPEHVVLSGEGAAVEAVLRALVAEGVAAQRLTVSHAFHSPLIDPALGPLEEAARRVPHAPPQIGFVSNLSGGLVEGGEVDAAYWRRHARGPVEFAAGVRTLHALGVEVFVEVGPHPVLTGMARECLPAGAGAWLPSLRRGHDDGRQMLDSLGELYARGFEVSWEAVYPGAPRRLFLPAYPFQRERYWWTPAAGGDAPGEAAGPAPAPAATAAPPCNGRPNAAHPLLGERLRTAVPIYQSRLGPGVPEWLDGHRVCGLTVVPGAAWLEMALAAARAEQPSGAVGLRDVEFARLLPLAPGRARALQIVLTPAGPGTTAFEIHSQPEDAAAAWTLHARGRVVAGERLLASSPLSDLRFRLRESVGPDAFYEGLAGRGFAYGRAFRCVEELWRRDGEALGRLRLPGGPGAHAGAWAVHPALVAAAFPLVAAALPAGLLNASEGTAFVPAGLSALCLHRGPGAGCWAHALLRHAEAGRLEADLRLFAEGGAVALEIAGLRLEALAAKSPPPEAGDASPAAAALDRGAVLAAAAPDRHGLVQSYLHKHLAEALGLAEPRLDVTAPLHHFGLDSLTLFRLSTRLERDLGVQVRMADLAAGPSVAALAAAVLEKMTRPEI
jgi:myxalamid-type polyketide synthase MxaB